jgi:hypothetical protein
MKRYFINIAKCIFLLLLIFTPVFQSQAFDLVSLFGIKTPFDFIQVILSGVSYVVLFIVSRLLWLAGLVFDASISVSLNMAVLLKAVPIVDIGWVIFRDLANMLFIFILIYTGIKTIIGLEGNTGKVVTEIIVMALLINFSLFITKTIVDASNIVALRFYNAMVGPGGDVRLGDFKIHLTNGVSSKFISGLNLLSIYGYGSQTQGIIQEGSPENLFQNQAGNSGNKSNTLNENLKNVTRGVLKLTPLRSFAGPLLGDSDSKTTIFKIISITFFGSILVLVAAFVFFAGAILFTIRSVVLLLLMILAPLAFAAELLPKTKTYANKWWDTLTNQALFAPLYMAVIYVVVRAINTEAFGNTFQKGSLANALGGSGLTTGLIDSLGMVLGFIIVIILMASALLIAKTLGAVGFDMAKNFAGKMSFGAAGLVGRQTIGRGAQKIADSAGFKNLVGTGRLGQLTSRALGGVAKSSFDLRGTSVVGKNLGNLVGGFGTYKSQEERTKEEEEAQKTRVRLQREADNKALAAAVSRPGAPIANIIQGLDPDQFKAIDPKIFVNSPLAAMNLNMDQIKKLQNNPSVTQADRAAIRRHILNTALPGSPTHNFMNNGPGSALWV